MAADPYYDDMLRQRGLRVAFEIAADDATKLRRRVNELERQLADHRCGLPASIVEALNSGDGTYRP